MKPEVLALARHRFARAREALAEGERLLATDSPRGAVNRLYYATFYAARALLATKERDTSKHRGVISMFQREFVKTGRVNRDLARVLPRLFEKRQRTDYADFADVGLEEASDLHDQARAFVDECERVLERLVAGGDG